MGDEELFSGYMLSSGVFSNLKVRFFILDPVDPAKEVEVDNVGQKSKTLFVFEGKKGQADVSQLIERFRLFQYNKLSLLTVFPSLVCSR